MFSYNDDDAGAKPTAAAPAQPDQYAAAQPTTEMKQEEMHDNSNGHEQYQDYSGGDYQQQGNYDEEGEEDDDDEIDFNLGNGPSNTIIHHDQQHQDDQDQNDEKPSYNAQSAQPQHQKGPNAKEDG